jgi:glucosamine 6-phosphate synthetase-like amidotransferase/phosphosugar isomerase protein
VEFSAILAIKIPPAFLLAGLRELEYQGYDSAGLAILDEGGAFLQPR